MGATPILITVKILGTLGEITVDMGEALSEILGVRGLSLTKLLYATVERITLPVHVYITTNKNAKVTDAI
eukprot:7416435-Pyramimonas_sp.AAC.1